jgi:Zn-dependent M28 family amino/carboxypeptidase
MKKALGAAALCAALLAPAVAQASDTFNSTPYRNKVTVSNMLVHSRALQSIADANGGNRQAGTSGNVATVDYIVAKMRAQSGWKVQKQAFEFPYFDETAPPAFSRTSPDPATFKQETGDPANPGDFATMTYSGSGDITAPVTPVGPLNVPIGATPAGSTISGCAASDFAGFPAGNIALVQRGTCTFGVKAQNAKDAGASAVVVFNEGQAGRQDAVAGTLGAPTTIPAIGTTYALGADTVQRVRGGQTVVFHVTTHTISEVRTTYNVIADSPGGDPNRTVVVSAHNDSVPAGPGINDDGTGIAMDLELAKYLGRVGQKPNNHVRFLWVGAEELGLLGSQHYVDSLTQAQRAKIMAMLDFDMVASPNYARQVYDGDGSTFGADASGPNGSGYIESLFNGYFAGKRQASEPIPFDGRSDYVAFTNAGIPSGGIFTGAEQIKTHQEFLLFGGTEGEALDHCYHQACDDITNLNLKAWGEMKDAAADVLYQLALTKNPITDGSTPKHSSTKKNAVAAKRAKAARSHRRSAKLGRGAFRGEIARR